MYITAYKNHRQQPLVQVDVFDMFFKNITADNVITNSTYNRTYTVEAESVKGAFNLLPQPLQEIKTLTDMLPNIDKTYHEFLIPKTSGGYRKISAPNENLKAYQRLFVQMLKHAGLLYHDAAFAYIENRCAKQAIERHQANQSNWFLKIDLKDFFPSCTMDFVINTLWELYPLCEFPQTTKLLFEPCFLNGALPQGSPASPFLSNLLMIQYDYKINKVLYNHNRKHFVYTRYADDILISCREEFDSQEIIKIIEDILPQELKINKTKTRYGSKAGRNWNLGLMLNQHNDITIGYKEKQRIRAALYSFSKDIVTGTEWPSGDKAHLQGQLAYLKFIEPEYYEAIIKKYNELFNVDILYKLK